MPEFMISLDRHKSHIADYKVEQPTIECAHVWGQAIKKIYLSKEKYDSFGEPKIPEDIILSTKLLAE